jgi:hypothetical protein
VDSGTSLPVFLRGSLPLPLNLTSLLTMALTPALPRSLAPSLVWVSPWHSLPVENSELRKHLQHSADCFLFLGLVLRRSTAWEWEMSWNDEGLRPRANLNLSRDPGYPSPSESEFLWLEQINAQVSHRLSPRSAFPTRKTSLRNKCIYDRIHSTFVHMMYTGRPCHQRPGGPEAPGRRFCRAACAGQSLVAMH